MLIKECRGAADTVALSTSWSFAMTLKRIALSTGLAVLALGAIANDAHHSSEPPASATSASGADSVSSTATASMDEYTKRMQEQMSRIRATSDAKERSRLDGGHMKTMDEAMPTMERMMKRMQMMGSDKMRCAHKS